VHTGKGNAECGQALRHLWREEELAWSRAVRAAVSQPDEPIPKQVLQMGCNMTILFWDTIRRMG
jgi:hypothetical protein